MMLNLAFVVLVLPLAVHGMDPPFPKLPNKFISEIEANILNRNYTLQVTEYYDQTQDGARIETLRNGSLHVTTYDFNNQYVYSTDVDARTCVARKSAPGPRSFGTPGADGKLHLMSLSDFFRFGKQYHDQYLGTATVRGILCDKYQSVYTNTTNGFFSNYTMHWYFARQDDWTMPVGGVSPGIAVPVRLHLVGESNATRVRPGMPVPTTPLHSFEHVYEFTAFRIGSLASIERSMFDPPHGIQCTGLELLKKIPTLPQQFTFSSTSLAFNVAAGRTTFYAYDALRREVAIFYARGDQHNATTNDVGDRVIHNFREGTEYLTTKNSCKVSSIASVANTTFLHDSRLFHNHRVMVSPGGVFGFTPDQNFTYQGTRTINGYATDLWIVIRHDSKLVKSGPDNQPTLWEYYFTQPKYWTLGISTVQVNAQNPVFVEGHSLIPGYEDSHRVSVSIGAFNVGPAPSHVFDNMDCFSGKQRASLTFTIDTSFDNQLALRQSITNEVASIMNVTVDRFHLDIFPGPGNKLKVLLHAHDVPSVGDPSLLKGLTSLETALRNLRKAIDRGRFSVSAPGMKAVKAASGSLESSASQEKTTFSGGEMAGLAIGVVILGFFLGAAGVFAWQRRIFSDMPYASQS